MDDLKLIKWHFFMIHGNLLKVFGDTSSSSCRLQYKQPLSQRLLNLKLNLQSNIYFLKTNCKTNQFNQI